MKENEKINKFTKKILYLTSSKIIIDKIENKEKFKKEDYEVIKILLEKLCKTIVKERTIEK